MKTSLRPSHLLPRIALGCMALVHAAVFAHGAETEMSDEPSWGVGIAAMQETRPYRDVDNKTEVLPLLTFENRWFRIFGPGLEIKLGHAGPVAFGLTASYAADGYKASDSPALAGMAERKNSAWVGARASARTDWATLSAEWSGDASGHSDGQKLKLGIERRFAMGDLGVTPRVTATWLDRKFTRYYYGVSAGEAQPGRSTYAPDSAVNTSLGVRLDYRVAPQQTLFLDLGVEALDKTIRNSPLVDRRSVPEVRLGYHYRF